MGKNPHSGFNLPSYGMKECHYRAFINNRENGHLISYFVNKLM